VIRTPRPIEALKRLAGKPNGRASIKPRPIHYASAMSYVGITKRTTAWIRKTGTSPIAAGLAWTAGLTFLMCIYVLLVGWYFVTLVIFGWSWSRSD